MEAKTAMDPVTLHESKIIISVPSLKLAPPTEAGVPEIVMVGRSNVGKSSFINAMLLRKNLARTSNTPGKTRLMNFYEATCSSTQFEIPERWRFVDLPGYGFAKVSKAEMADWNKNFQAYLKHRERIDMVVQLIDGRHGYKETDASMLEWLMMHNLPVMVVITKLDKCKNQRERQSVVQATKRYLDSVQLGHLSIIPFSAETKEGRIPCWLSLLDAAGLPNLTEQS